MAKSLTEYIIRVRSEDDLNTLILELESWNIKIVCRYQRIFSGICVLMTGLLAKKYKDDYRVLSIEESTIIQHFSQQLNAPPHLDRLDQRLQPLSGSFTFALDGTGVIAYVLDSGFTGRGLNSNGEFRGIDLEEFNGRFQPVPDPFNTAQAFDPFFDNLSENVQLNNPRGFDGFGHGTHVAGIVGSNTYGVAKNVSIRTSKIFGSLRTTSISIILAGMDAILADHIALGSPLAVCNMSFGGNISVILEIGVQALIDNGIVVVVAAGNSGINAENTSPARMPTVITVGAVDRADNMANFSNFQNLEDIVAPDEVGFEESTLSNFGSVVDIFAVGVSVLSTWITPNSNGDNINTLTGTSMSSPAVAGVVALFIENASGSTPATIKTDLINNATTGEINLTDAAIAAGTPNNLLYSTFVDINIEWITPIGSLGSFFEGRTANIFLEAITFSGLNVIYSIDAGTLPSGLSLDGNTGIISGILQPVTTNQTFSITIRASDGSLFSPIFEIREFTIEVVNQDLPPIWATNSDLGEIEEGQALNIAFSAFSRNDLPVSSLVFSVVGGFLPHGWLLSSSGVLTGISPQNITGELITGFTLSVSDGLAFAEETFTITILQVVLPTTEPEWITDSGNIGVAVENDFFSTFLVAVDGDNAPLPLTYHLELTTDNSTFGPFGELPPGLSLNSATGEISGTAGFTGVDTIFEFAVFVTDGANTVVRLFNIESLANPINVEPVWITSAGSLGSADSLIGASFLLQAIDSDGIASPIQYVFVSGQLPPGLVLNASSGVISGVPQLVATDTLTAFTIGANDGLAQVNRTFSITINRINVGPEWQTSEGQILSVNEGVSLNFSLIATDANNDELTYILSNGEFPPGVSMNSSGFISGIIENIDENTEFNFVVEVNDSISNTLSETISATREFSILVINGALNVNVAPVWITPSGPLVQGNEGLQYFTQIEAIDPDGISSPIQYFVSAGNFPAGLALNANTGIISGFPQLDDNIIDDTFEFIVQAFDGLAFTSQSFSIEIIDLGDENNPPIWLTPAGDLGSFNESVPLIISLSASDPDDDVVTYSIIGVGLPSGIVLDETLGILSGTPDQVVSDTIFNFTVRAIDSGGQFVDRSFFIEIFDIVNIPPVWITSTGLIGIFNEGTIVDIDLIANDPDLLPNPTLTFNITNQSLPPGLILISTTGKISGTLLTVISDTTFVFEITVDDGLAFIPREFSIAVVNIPEFTGTTLDLSIPILGDLRNEWKIWNNAALISDTDLFLPTIPNFGRITEPKIFIVSNFHTDDPDLIFQSFGEHHQRFNALFGAPELAVVRNETGDIIYEVIYLKMLDPQKGSDFNITNIPDTSSFDTNGVEDYISKSFFHLREEIIVNFNNNDELPAWMRSEQIFGDSNSILGYVPAVVVAFIQPGTGIATIERINEIIQTTIILAASPTTFDNNTTIFDGGTTTFDNISQIINQTAKAVGYQFTGREFVSDRYAYKTTLNAEGYIKFSADTNNPIWLTLPGDLGDPLRNRESKELVLEIDILRVNYSIGSPLIINLEAESITGENLIYAIIFGSLPDGLSLDVNTGIISGTPTDSLIVGQTTFDGNDMTFDGNTTTFDAAETVAISPFIVRVSDNNNSGNFADQVFEIAVF